MKKQSMISVQEARSLVESHATSEKITPCSLSDAVGLCLAKAVVSPIDSPLFDQSAMDGYALSLASWDGSSEFMVIGEIQAGVKPEIELKAGEAMRIFTGAPVPKGADTVVMQEKVTTNDNVLQIHDTELKFGANIRLRGSQIRKGEIALPEGLLLNPAAMSFLAGLGISEVAVYNSPVVCIIATGKELITDQRELSEGMIYESNTVGLTAALKQRHIQPDSVHITDDNEVAIMKAFLQCQHADMVIITGGVSVGEYDLVPASLERCGVRKIFHKVKQKPGKPLFFGTKDKTLVFALPGNPAAVLSCYYQYIYPAIDSFVHFSRLKEKNLPLMADYTKKAGLTFFLKAKATDLGVEILSGQESYLLHTFSLANALVELPEEGELFPAGTMVSVRIIE